ncbi:MAG: hypothetical protein VXW15_14060 [Bdellovibrionota bacterium]|nr:hypothetical protein [Bdellovibrionota bacterium]
MKKLMVLLFAMLSFSAFSSDAKKVFLNDTYWKKKIPSWKEYKLKAGNTFITSPACSQAAASVIGGLTAERAAIKGKKPKHAYNIISPIFNYLKSGYIYYTKQRGYEKYNQLIEEASVVIAGKDHVVKTKKFDHFAKKVMKKAVEDTVKMKSVELTANGTYRYIPNGQNKEVKLKKVNRLHIATNLLMGDAAGYFCSFDVLRMADKSLNFNKVKILKKSALVGLFQTGPMKSRKFMASAKKFEELRLYVNYLKEKKEITTSGAGYAQHWKKVTFKKQDKLRKGYEKQIKVILMEADDKLIASQFNKLIDKMSEDHWKKDLDDY